MTGHAVTDVTAFIVRPWREDAAHLMLCELEAHEQERDPWCECVKCRILTNLDRSEEKQFPTRVTS